MCISKTTLVNYETGLRTPDADFLNKILAEYPDVNPAWLLAGEGQIARGASTYAIRNAEGQFESIQPDTVEKILEGFDTLKDSGITLDNLNKAIVLSIAYEYFRYYKKTVPSNIKRFVLAYLYVMEDMPARGKQEHMFDLIDRALATADSLTMADLPIHNMREERAE
jgi:hypothetical protein